LAASVGIIVSMSEYVVIYEQADDGAWGAYMPDLPGIVALGTTHVEVAARIREALAAYTDDLRLQGQSLPTPHHHGHDRRVTHAVAAAS
jgi:predicted RNase H-like HicB family nuclease